ncbi:MAG: DISARM system helicase DrmA, partial [Anaerolineae bacterium]|nr:DISARM system helicase DrmA [Anaerolineae bacterium]
MPDKLKETIPSPLELRAKLEEMVRADLLGPAGGPEEIVDERNVRDRYIVGRLAPRGQRIVPDEQDDLAVDGDADSQDGKTESGLAQAVTIYPSSLGLTFTVDGNAEAIEVTARWGQYKRVQAETISAYQGHSRVVWQRSPVEAVSPPIPLQPGELGPWHPDPENEDVYARGLCRRRDDAWTITLFLVNAQREPKVRKDEAWLFQPELVVAAPDNAPIFVKRQLPPELNTHEPEDRVMQMLYRRQVEFAVGHNTGVHVEPAPDRWNRATAVRTEVIPAYEVERMDPPALADVPELGQAVFDMKTLAETELGNFSTAIAPLTTAYENWIKTQETRLAQPTPDLQPYLADGQQTLNNCREALARIRAGLALLDENPQAADAFQFANRAMYLQRIRSIYARLVRQGQQPDLAQIDQPQNRSWRPFQLAFVLLNLPGLVDPTHPDRSDATGALADLLWFPTGGGKTEAYLGVAAFTMALRRLQPELGGLSGQAGVAVLMRYTLRLLTLQQFQRATALICACEIIRRENPAQWGIKPFRIGLWVGQSSTPNWTKDAAEAIKKDHDLGWGGGRGGGGTPHQITNCPWCGQPINPGKNIVVETYEQGRGRTFQFCSDKLGQCPFSRRQSPDEGLPIVVVDEEIYRRLPTLLIATVDKFAQMPWKGATQMLFGRVSGYCPRHGYRSPEVDDADSHPKKGGLPACKTQAIGPLRPPDLIIQDELHLISGPLGTLVGLYETAVDRLATWELNGAKIRPKVIASTATIRRARHQVNSLFLRQVKIFPPAALDADDNFFSRRRPSSNEAPGRHYIGICASGTRLKLVLIRVYVAYLAAAQ